MERPQPVASPGTPQTCEPWCEMSSPHEGVLCSTVEDCAWDGVPDGYRDSTPAPTPDRRRQKHCRIEDAQAWYSLQLLLAAADDAAATHPDLAAALATYREAEAAQERTFA